MVKKKIFIIIITVLIGSTLGAYLGYGPMQQFKSEADINIGMSTTDYKRFTDLVSNQDNLKKYIENTKSFSLTNEQVEYFIQNIRKNDWYKPTPRISKTEYKDLSDSIIRLEQETSRKKDKLLEAETEKMFGKDSNPIQTDFLAFTSLKIIGASSNSMEAVERARWLSNYAHNTAVLDAVESLVTQWENEGKLFEERFQVAKLQNDFESEQLKLKIFNLKKAIANSPKSVNYETLQTIESGRDSSKSMTVMAKLFLTEIDLMDINFKNIRLDHVHEQQNIVQEIVRKYIESSDTKKSGLEKLNDLEKLIKITVAKNEAHDKREKLISIESDVSSLKSRLIKKEFYITKPEMQVQSTSVSAFKLMLIFSWLFAFLAVAYLWRKSISNFLLQKENSFLSLKNN